ncbi:MAG TPA: M12 family metallopeptidase [Verrucomicrobiae bacterium]|jgi:titin|nr:M12 family metallopeptidase [Verrucomicrobiae bacterium]
MNTGPRRVFGKMGGAFLFFWTICCLQTLSAANFYQGVATNTLPWPGGIIPYVFTTNVTSAEQTVYLDGMKEWELAANIHFVPRTTETYYVILDLDFTEGTNTYYASDPPVMTIDNLSRAQICHETGHLLGFQHEHVRIDRDDYIVVNFTNIEGYTSGQGSSSTNLSDESGGGEAGDGSPASLYLIDTNSTPNGAYDFESVMHYSRTLYSIDPATLDVIDPLSPYVYKYYNRIGNFALSVGDRASAAYLYGPPTAPLTNVVTTTADGGLGSLRAAIYFANDHPGTAIRFDIATNDPGFSNGVYTIFVSGQLPPLVADGTVIDATTQPGYAGQPIVALDGSQIIPEVEFTVSGLYLYSGNCAVRGLAFDNFSLPGLSILYNYAVGNHIENCYIGLAPDGVTVASNGYEGIAIDAGAHANVIGGTNAALGNVISGNGGYGITITSSNTVGNIVAGNYIGLNADGTAAITNLLSGIGIWGGSSSNVIGLPAAGNVLSGNGQYGVFIGDSNTMDTVVAGNYVGTDGSGTFAVPNGYGGVGVLGGANNVTIGPGNVLSGNANAGLWLDGPGITNNVVEGNFIGVNASGTAAIPNGWTGIYILAGSSGNTIGGTAPGDGNVISGNVSEGVFISDPGTTNNFAQGNFIGCGPFGTNAIGNGYTGVGIWSGAAFNLIGGTNAAQRNYISGGAGNGISMGGSNVTGNLISGNFIGTTPDGMDALGNQGIGVYVESGPQSNLIGGALAGAGNLISANGGDGIQLWGPGTEFNTVQGNLVGADVTGKDGLGNYGSGLSIISGPELNTIGGATDAARNIFSGNQNGLYLFDATNNLVEGDYIGTDVSGETALSNGSQGVLLIGGSESNQLTGNVIAGNVNNGIYISDSGTGTNFVQANKIGVAADGVTALGNGNQGIFIFGDSSGNVIGFDVSGNGAGNIIADNTDEGVIIYTNSVGNTIRGNSIFGNGQLGINLVAGPPPGPNDLQSYPVLNSASAGGGSTVIAGTLHSAPNRTFLIDVYRNIAPDLSGFGQGQFPAGATSLQTDAGGNGSFSISLAGSFAGQYFSATATDATTGDTSEFSFDIVATNAANPGPGGFSGPFIWSSNGFSFDLSGPTNQNYTVEVATNLSAQPVLWSPLTNFFATTVPVRILDTNIAPPARFYRIVTP